MNKWREVIKKAKSYKAIGQTSIYLSDDDEKPWALVNKIEAGGLYRLNTAVSISFEATHHSGLSFRWSEDMEERRANGSGRFHVDVLKATEHCIQITTFTEASIPKSNRCGLRTCKETG